MRRTKILVFVILFIITNTYGVDQHQIGVYTSVGYSQQLVDLYENIYDTMPITLGISYRWNRFLSEESIHFFSVMLGLGGGAIFSKSRLNQEILNYNSLLELELFAGYGLSLGKYKEHQMSIVGVSFLPKFYGLIERDNYTQIGSTEVEWYKGFYTPVSVGIYLPSYRYVYNQFYIGFQHSVNFLVTGHQNVNVPEENLILRSRGYQFRMELGWNHDSFSSRSSRSIQKLEATRIFVETNRNTVLISIFAKTELEDTKFVTIEVFALDNFKKKTTTDNWIAYASKIPVYNGQAQFTKYWKSENFLGDTMNMNKKWLYIVVKELDSNGQLQREETQYYALKEQENE